MNYTEALEYLKSASLLGCRPGLGRTRELLSRLGNPQNDLRFVHVAGTNGKGSFCAMCASVLTSAGYVTGRYISPSVDGFNEKISVDGREITDEELAEIASEVSVEADKMPDKPTEFELLTAMAFLYFKRQGCDIAVLEAGMGGRLDATNVIESTVLSVITGVSLDHTAFLGDTVEKIAAEKAGIIKKGVPVLYGGESVSVGAVIKAKAEETGSELYLTDRNGITDVRYALTGTEFSCGGYKNLKIKLLGTYQPRNAANVVSAVSVLNKYGYGISEKALRDGLLNTVWKGRFEILSDIPLVISDGAHNPEGISCATESIKKYFGNEKVLLVTGVLADKDYSAMIKTLSEITSSVYTVTPPNPRALSAERYAEEFKKAGIRAEAFSSVEKAVLCAMTDAERDGVPAVCLGSLYMYGEIKAAVRSFIKNR